MISRLTFSLVAAGACFTAALGVSMLALGREDAPNQGKLADAMSKQIAGWEGQDLPLGDTEVKNATTKLLNYDDYLYRVYRRGGSEVFVYAMYWKQGSISVREIAGHTPDGCWIANGAQIGAPKATRGLAVGGRATAPAEVREFRFPGGQRVEVAWWHLWGDNLIDRRFDQKSLSPTLRELWVWLGKRHGAQRDQLLVRIHTTEDLATVMKSPPVRSFLDQFPIIFSATPL